jgi:DNA repair/transcription protein MET18/MMS19
MDGEKDPRNLLVCFSVLSRLGREYLTDPSHVSVQPILLNALIPKDFFEVFSCYFPVRFTPPPNDTVGISRSQIVDALK